MWIWKIYTRLTEVNRGVIYMLWIYERKNQIQLKAVARWCRLKHHLILLDVDNQVTKAYGKSHRKFSINFNLLYVEIPSRSALLELQPKKKLLMYHSELFMHIICSETITFVSHLLIYLRNCTVHRCRHILLAIVKFYWRKEKI